MKEMLIKITRDNYVVNVTISADGYIFRESNNFCSPDYSEGMMSDIFHELTGNRYKNPTDAFQPENFGEKEKKSGKKQIKQKWL